LDAFAKLRKATLSFVLSVCPSVRPSVCMHGTTRLPLEGFLWTFILYTKMNVCLYVCLYLIQIHISEPIGTKLCTHLPRGMEETVGYIWAHNISPFPPFRLTLSGARDDSYAGDGCRRHTASLLRYLRDAARTGVTSRTWRARWVCNENAEKWTECVCVKMETWWDGKEVTNEFHLQLHCIYTNDNVKPF
jgi:hypothetical protein